MINSFPVLLTTLVKNSIPLSGNDSANKMSVQHNTGSRGFYVVYVVPESAVDNDNVKNGCFGSLFTPDLKAFKTST
jgi:hypothetical protein